MDLGKVRGQEVRQINVIIFIIFVIIKIEKPVLKYNK